MSDDQKLVELCDELRLLASHLTGDDFDRRPWAANRASHVIEAQGTTIAELRAKVDAHEQFREQMTIEGEEYEATIDRLTAENERLDAVARSAWHLMDDSGDTADPMTMTHERLDHEQLSNALDALEASGWSIDESHSEAGE